jgi:hypothetical protein
MRPKQDVGARFGNTYCHGRPGWNPSGQFPPQERHTDAAPAVAGLEVSRPGKGDPSRPTSNDPTHNHRKYEWLVLLPASKQGWGCDCFLCFGGLSLFLPLVESLQRTSRQQPHNLHPSKTPECPSLKPTGPQARQPSSNGFSDLPATLRSPITLLWPVTTCRTIPIGDKPAVLGWILPLGPGDRPRWRARARQARALWAF